MVENTVLLDNMATTASDDTINLATWTETQVDPLISGDFTMCPHHLVMIRDGSLEAIDSELAEYVRYEARERGVSEEEIYAEEVEAARAIAELEITEEFLEKAARIPREGR